VPGEFQRYAAEAFRQMEAGAPAHPATETIADYVRGRLPEPKRAAIAAHLDACAECRECAREFEQFAADAAGAEEPPADMDAAYRELERRLPRRSVIQMPRRWMAIAAMLVAALGVAAGIYGLLTPSTPKLLAEAYRERRFSELRIAGADYAPLRQERAGGSSFSLPSSLLKAQSRIKDDLQSNATDPTLLRLEGEAQMVEADAASAVQTLRRSNNLRPGDANTLAALGAAYAMLGDANHEFGDYKQAVNYLEQSLQLEPNSLEARFNRAVVLEKLLLYPEAATEWEAYLKADAASGWATEARQRLAAVLQKLGDREKKLGQVRDDPAYFLKLAGANQADSEAWLIGASSPWLTRSATDPQARQAVVRLAALLESGHGDRWLRDMTSGACVSASASAALHRLLAADDAANNGGYQSALDEEEQSARQFERAGCGAGAARARVSEVIALAQMLRTEDCRAAAGRLGSELEAHAYIRLRGRVARQTVVCAERLGRLEEASAALRRALAMAEAAHYPITLFDLATLALDDTRTSELPSQTADRVGEALRMFWAGAYQRDSILVPLNELWQQARDEGERGAALHIARAEVWAASGPAIPGWRVFSYNDLGVAEREAGDLPAARRDLEASARAAEKVPAQFRIPPAAALARLDLQNGRTSTALARMAPFGSLAPKLPWAERADYYSALGEALTRQGALPDAAAAFRNVIDSAREYLANLRGEDERASVLKTVESAYRGLVEARLAAPGNEAAALEVWREYRNFDAAPGAHHASTDDASLWFVELPNGYAAWFARQERVVYHRVEPPKDRLEPVAHRFLEECGEPQSSEADLGADARDLYRWLIEPFAAEIGPTPRTLVFELDGALSALPFGALLTADGAYFGDRYAILISSGRAAHPYTGPDANAQALLVVNPAIAGRAAVRFPPLPDSAREAAAVRTLFRNNVTLEGRAATLEALAAGLPRAAIVHFAGHGYSASGFGGLLFAPRDPAAADYALLTAAGMRQMDWSRCRLAVLSACAAAEGETHGAHNPESLIRALTRAGAPRIAANLWNVDSAAAVELMTRFYQEIRNGAGVPESLRRAGMAVRASARWTHPYYWAGFQLYGAT
jgi:CHAT domain-containing protein/tetratricopeptide (TPR) repeat protein